MIIEKIQLNNFRNYSFLDLSLSRNINLFYGDNAQGKSNLLEAVYFCVTTKSFRNNKENELIQFGNKESHIHILFNKNEIDYEADFHLLKNDKKKIFLNKIPVSRAKDYIGNIYAVLFSPQDLKLIQSSPSERRGFLDREISLLDKVYLNAAIQYRKALENRNVLLKNKEDKNLKEQILPWNQMLIHYGKILIEKRSEFISELQKRAADIHKNITGNEEEIEIQYEPSVTVQNFSVKTEENFEKDLISHSTSLGPHRDDLAFFIKERGKEKSDLRLFGSQGQQRTGALTLKLSEIQYIKETKKESPILLLDDVLSELDQKRQKYLIESIQDIQTIITGTEIDHIWQKTENVEFFKVKNGVVEHGNERRE